jgi:hypothetical protein
MRSRRIGLLFGLFTMIMLTASALCKEPSDPSASLQDSQHHANAGLRLTSGTTDNAMTMRPEFDMASDTVRCARFNDGMVLLSHKDNRGAVHSISMPREEWIKNLSNLLDAVQADRTHLPNNTYSVNKVNEQWSINRLGFNNGNSANRAEELPGIDKNGRRPTSGSQRSSSANE